MILMSVVVLFKPVVKISFVVIMDGASRRLGCVMLMMTALIIQMNLIVIKIEPVVQMNSNVKMANAS